MDSTSLTVVIILGWLVITAIGVWIAYYIKSTERYCKKCSQFKSPKHFGYNIDVDICNQCTKELHSWINTNYTLSSMVNI